MLVESFYPFLAQQMLREAERGTPLRFAIGSGQVAWDTRPITPASNTRQLENEVFRKPIAVEDMHFLDSRRQASLIPTSLLQLSVNFERDEGEGSIRECGIFALADNETEPGVLISYFIHPRVEKLAEGRLERRVTLNLAPQRAQYQGHLTAFLGNVHTQELHDLARETARCQIAEIRTDRRHYFTSPQDALTLGYDHCAYCFGRALSQR